LAWCYLGTALARASSYLLDGGSFSRYTFICVAIEGSTALLLGIHCQRLLREHEELEDEEDLEDSEEMYEEEF
jgi:hypothetical protein